MKFGEQIKERRQELDLTQAEVAEKYFVTRQAVSNWEHDKTYPDLNMLVKISNVYQISLDSLLREDQKLKDYLEQGRAMNSFSVSYGFIWVMFGLSYFLDDSTKGGSIAWYGMVAIFLLAMIYEELVTPFFLGINRRTFYRSGKRPDEKLSIFAKRTIPLRVDTLNNKSVNPRGVFCIVSYSTIEKLKLLHDYQKSDYGLTVYSDYHGVRPANMSKWIKQFLLAGLAGLIRPKHNQKYSLETKLTAVKAYLSGKYTNQAILQQYQIRNISQLHQWVISYNNDKLRVNQTTRKRVRKMGRKVTFDEKRQIVRWTIEHNNNYKAAAEKYDISYQRVYSWVRKYRVNSDWEVLKDNRGRNKGKEPTNELEKLRKRVRELEARDCERELQIAFAKKLVKIRNREVKRPDDIKRFKK